MAALWLLPLLGAIVGGLILAGAVTSANGAPQEAAGAAIAVAIAVLPYVFARSIEKLAQPSYRITPAAPPPPPSPTGRVSSSATD